MQGIASIGFSLSLITGDAGQLPGGGKEGVGRAQGPMPASRLERSRKEMNSSPSCATIIPVIESRRRG